MRQFTIVMLTFSLAACNSVQLPPLTASQQQLVNDVEVVGVELGCQKLEQTYRKIGKPSALQQSAMAYVRTACLDSGTTIDQLKERAANLAAAI